METVQIAPNVTALVTPVPVPGVGVLPINAYVIATGSPILVDSCMTVEPGEFVKAVASVIDPADLKTIWLTHADRDHTGALLEILDAAPGARLITNFVTLGHLMAGGIVIPPDRTHVINSGQNIDVGDRELVALRPPLFDNPGTVGFFDPKNRVLVASDFLGGPMSSLEEAMIPDVGAISDDQLSAAQLLWGSADAPWVHSVDEKKFATSLADIRKLDPELVLPTHLPAIHGDLERHLDNMARLPGAPPSSPPDQETLMALLAQMDPEHAG